MVENPFDDAELAERHAAVRAAMDVRGVEVAMFTAPENVFYLTGLDHWGYFAPHVLIVPVDGETVLVTRAMERVTVEKQVRNARFSGHEDSETAADMAVRVMRDAFGDTPLRIGVEAWSSGHSHGFGATLRQGLPSVEWIDVTGLVDGLRLVKSPAEQALMRAAARVSDAAAGAAIAAIGDGAAERDVAAECHAAMLRAGGDPPGFGPFIRPGSRLGEEHGTWGSDRHRAGEPVFLELSGCVSRYHAPLGRLVHVGSIRGEDRRMAETATAAFDAALAAVKPGAKAREVYGAWQAAVDAAGLSGYRRHHCGYAVGIGVPPSWTGGNRVTGLSAHSGLEIRPGMSFHLLSWLMGTGRGDFFLSNTVLVTDNGAEVLCATPNGPTIR